MIRLQHIMQRKLADYQQARPLTPRQHQVSRHILACRTAAMGGERLHCDQCRHEQPLYYACRDRHCPRCQQSASQRWVDKQRQWVAPVHYFHMVFTLPHDLNGWARLHPTLIYRLLFQSVWHTLRTFGADPRRLNGQLGMTAVLHTWGQSLNYHIHLHCLIPGGALDSTGKWHCAKSRYLFPVRALSRHYRGAMVSALRNAADNGQLHRITRPGEIDRVLDQLMKTAWVVYGKPCLNKPETVIQYLGRYSHRTALSDGRLIAMEDHAIRFRYTDYRDNQNKVMALKPEEFLRRFLQHVLPKGFMRIRHYGWLANACRAKKLEQIKAAIAAQEAEASAEISEPLRENPQSAETWPCPCCKTGRMRVCETLPPMRLEGG